MDVAEPVERINEVADLQNVDVAEPLERIYDECAEDCVHKDLVVTGQLSNNEDNIQNVDVYSEFQNILYDYASNEICVKNCSDLLKSQNVIDGICTNNTDLLENDEGASEQQNLADDFNSDDVAVMNPEILSELVNLTLDDDPDLQSEAIKADEHLTKKVEEIKSEFSVQRSTLNLMSLIRNDEDLIAFTGLPFSLLNNLTKAVNMCEKKGCSYKFTNSARDRIVLTFCKLRLNLSFRCLACLFGLSRKSAAKNFFYMVELLSAVLEGMVRWPTYEQIKKSMPKCFKKYSNTFIVLDCTEVPVEKPKCLACRLRLYSHYKGMETIKWLVGVAPSGALIFWSEAYGGRASDKAIFNQSDLLRKLEPTRDAIMVDKGFDIEVECNESFIKLIMPPKLEKKKQFTVQETAATNDIAAARVHVERTIQRLKMFKILKYKIPWSLVPYIKKISIIVAGVTNLKKPILAEDKF